MRFDGGAVTSCEAAIQPPRPYSLFLEHGSAAKTLISHPHNTASYAGYQKSNETVNFIHGGYALSRAQNDETSNIFRYYGILAKSRTCRRLKSIPAKMTLVHTDALRRVESPRTCPRVRMFSRYILHRANRTSKLGTGRSQYGQIGSI